MKRLVVTLVALISLASAQVAVAGPAGAVVLVNAADTTPDTGGCGSPANPCNTIQAGVNNASPGDTVLVAPGTYTEQVTVGAGKNGITLRSREPLAATIKAPADIFRLKSREAELAEREGWGPVSAKKLIDALISTFASIGIDVLDQRGFVGNWLEGDGCWSTRRPDDTEWSDVTRGLALARMLANAGIGQTVVMRHGAVVAVEAVEGTTDTIRRGTTLAGPGAIIVKAVGRDHDYRFDTPAIGPNTIRAAAEGKASVVAVEANRVLILEREATLRNAETAGIAVVSVTDGRADVP